MGNRNSSDSSGCLMQLILYPTIVFCIFYYYYNKNENEYQSKVDEYTKGFNYSIDSVANMLVHMNLSNSDNEQFNKYENANLVDGNAIVFTKTNNEIKFDINVMKYIDDIYIAKEINLLKTIIVTTSGEKNVGQYSSSVPAIQRYKVIYFLDAKSKKVKKREIVYGTLPPNKTTRRRSTTRIEGSSPSSEVIGNIIKSYLTKIK